MSVTYQVPVITQIADVLFARLQTLVGSDSLAYQIPDVVRPTKLTTYAPRHGLIVLTRGDVQRVPELDCPGNPPAIAIAQTFLIRAHIAPSEGDETPVEVYEDVIEAAIHTAVKSGSETWYNFEELAINADFGAQVTATSDGSYDGIAVPLTVTYRITEGDPFTARG